MLESDPDNTVAAHNRVCRAVKAYKESEVEMMIDCEWEKNNAKIKELRWRLKVATDALTELQTRLVASVYDGKINPYEALEITERALAKAAGEEVSE